MRILVVGTHPQVRQPSMSLFAQWLVEACRPLGHVELRQAPAFFLSAGRKGSAAAKWLAYVDQYLLLPLQLWTASRRFDLVVVADQGNAPSALLVPGRKLVVMVHDTIAMRQALGRIPDAPATGRSGVILQALIRRSVRRARTLLSNPGAIPGEIGHLGLGRHVSVVGCHADYSRLASPAAALPVKGPYVLNVASDGWRKRKRSLIPLWKEVQARSGLQLVLAGHTDEETLQAFPAAGAPSPVVLNDVSDGLLARLYSGCEGLISSSHEEGLCIPILEAFHFDKPVFVPDVSPSYADFFGPAVTRLDFDDPARAAERMLSALRTGSDKAAVRAVQAWAAPAAFDRRVREALSPFAGPPERLDVSAEPISESAAP